jgi:CRP-like cAMP-binding protein
MIKEIIYQRPQLTEKILNSVMYQLEQTTQIAEEFIPMENVIDLNERVFQDGEVIIEEGTTGSEIFQLIESEKGLLVTKEGKEIGRISRSGEYFGEMSAILKQQRSATVRSIGRSIVHVFPGEDLDVMLEAYPKLSKTLIDTLAKRVLESSNTLAAQIGSSPAL